jgi:tetratricopeptide (TPR) repeat protein
MSNDDSSQDDGSGALALTALAAGGAYLLWKMFSSSEEKPKQPAATSSKGPPDYLMMAGILAQRGRYNEALQAVQLAIKANPTDPEPHNLFAWILATTGHPALDQALTGAKIAIQLATDPARLANYHDTLAEVYARMGLLDDAIYCFREALRLSPILDIEFKDFSPSFRLALCYLGQGNLNFSLANLKQALQAHPQNPVVALVMAHVCLMMRRLLEAPVHFQEALRLSQSWPNFRYPVMGNFPVETDRRAFQCECWTGLGATYYYFKDYARSRQANQQACNIFPDLPAAWINLACLAALAKDEQGIRRYLEAGLPLMHPMLHGRIRSYLLTTGDFGDYRPLMLSLLRTHRTINDDEYRAYSSLVPQGSTLPVSFSGAQIGVVVYGEGNTVTGGPQMQINQPGANIQGQNIAQGDMTIGVQNNAGRDINSGQIKTKTDFVDELKKLQAEMTSAAEKEIIDADKAADAHHQLQKAVIQASKPAPEKHKIQEHLETARKLIEGAAGAAGIISALAKLIGVIPHLF